MENNWEIIKQKKTEHLEKGLEVFVGKLERIHSNRISLEAIKGLMVNHQNERKPIKAVANLRISSNHELVVRSFEPKMMPLVRKTILTEVNQLVYKAEKSTKEEDVFILALLATQDKKKLIKNVNEITEEGKKNFRLIHQDLKNWLKKEPHLSQDQKKNYEKQADKLVKDYQDKLVAAEEKKIKELSS